MIKFVNDQALIHFALIGDKSSKGAYKEVIPTPPQILSKLDVEILILVLCSRLYTYHQESIRAVIEAYHIFAQLCTHLRFCVYVATPRPAV